MTTYFGFTFTPDVGKDDSIRRGLELNKIIPSIRTLMVGKDDSIRRGLEPSEITLFPVEFPLLERMTRLEED